MIQTTESDSCTSLEEKLCRQEPAKQNMTSASVFKAMLPSVAVGTLAAMGCQEFASKCHANPEYITLSGMAAQYFGGWAPFLFFHYRNNKLAEYLNEQSLLR